MLYPRATTNLQNNAFDWLRLEAEKWKISLTIAFFEDFMPDTFATKPDCVIMRGYNQTISNYFEMQGVWVINPWQAMQTALNKVLTYQVLIRENIPTPQTIYSKQTSYDFTGVCDVLNDNKFIIKKIDGSKGEKVFLVTTPDELYKAIESCDGNCLCQKYISFSRGRDIRVWVIGDKVAGAVERYNNNSFLSNFSQGGSARLIEVPRVVSRLAIDSAQIVGLGFAGIDILYASEDSYTVCEVNGNAGFRTISQFADLDNNNIPYQLFSYISKHFGLKSLKN